MKKQAKKSYHHGDLHSSLVTAAIALIRSKGPNSFSMRELAKQAEVSHTAPYRHFKNKNALFNEIAQGGFQQLSERMYQAAENNPTEPKQQMLEAGTAYVELATKNPEITQLMFGGYIEDCGKELTKAGDDAFKGLLAVIENGQAAGIYQSTDSMTLALATWSMVHGFAMLISAGQLKNEIKTKKQITDMTKILETILLNGMLK